MSLETTTATAEPMYVQQTDGKRTRSVALSQSTSGTSPFLKSKKTQRTFRKAKLESSFLEFCQLTSQPPATEGGTEARWSRLARTASDFIYNAEFDDPKSESMFLGNVLLGTGVQMEHSQPSRHVNLPPHLGRLCETKLLTFAEEQGLFRRLNYLRFRAKKLLGELSPATATEWDVQCADGLLKAADWHRDYIIKANMRLVISIVKKFANANNTFDDLLSDGIVALMRAVDKFDYDLGFRFSTYATQVVRRCSYRTVVQTQAERMKLSHGLHDPGIDVSDESRHPLMSEARWNALRSRLADMLDRLDRREKFIIRARFSLGGHRRVQTLQRLAEKLHVSKERVRQLEKRALDRLRIMAGGNTLPEIEGQ